MSWTFTLSGSAIKRAGANANSTLTQDPVILTTWSDQAEGQIVTTTRKDWLTAFSTLNDSIKKYLADLTDAIIARKIVNYDMTGYGLTLAQTTQDILIDDIKMGMAVLTDAKANEIRSTF